MERSFDPQRGPKAQVENCGLRSKPKKKLTEDPLGLYSKTGENLALAACLEGVQNEVFELELIRAEPHRQIVTCKLSKPPGALLSPSNSLCSCRNVTQSRTLILIPSCVLGG